MRWTEGLFATNPGTVDPLRKVYFRLGALAPLKGWFILMVFGIPLAMIFEGNDALGDGILVAVFTWLYARFVLSPTLAPAPRRAPLWTLQGLLVGSLPAWLIAIGIGVNVDAAAPPTTRLIPLGLALGVLSVFSAPLAIAHAVRRSSVEALPEPGQATPSEAVTALDNVPVGLPKYIRRTQGEFLRLGLAAPLICIMLMAVVTFVAPGMLWLPMVVVVLALYFYQHVLRQTFAPAPLLAPLWTMRGVLLSCLPLVLIYGVGTVLEAAAPAKDTTYLFDFGNVLLFTLGGAVPLVGTYVQRRRRQGFDQPQCG